MWLTLSHLHQGITKINLMVFNYYKEYKHLFLFLQTLKTKMVIMDSRTSLPISLLHLFASTWFCKVYSVHSFYTIFVCLWICAKLMEWSFQLWRLTRGRFLWLKSATCGLQRGIEIQCLNDRWWSMMAFVKFKVCSNFQISKSWKIRSLFCIYLLLHYES